MADVIEVATCDRHPSAVAAHFAVKGQALLAFCGHCGARHELALLADDWEVLHALAPVPVISG